MKLQYVLLFSFLIMYSCNSKKYLTSSYETLSPMHQTIAVLPYYNIYTGRIPSDLSEEEFLHLREVESVLFQRSLYFEILEDSGIDNGDINITLQDYTKTNKLLSEAGISIADSWTLSASEIAQIIGVDALVRVDLHKNFILSQTESLMVDVAINVIGMNKIPVELWHADKSSDVKIFARIIDYRNDVAVWAYKEKCPTNWRRNTDKVVDSINNKIARKFPYRS